MTWTVRAYDSDGTEIGWVTINPYEYEITHPDDETTEENRRVSYMFSSNEEPEERGVVQDDLGVVSTTVNFLEFESGQEHAEYIKDRLMDHTDLSEDAIEIADE
jgi:hypothetical protein